MGSAVILDYLKPYRFRLGLVGLLMLANSLVTLALPWLAGRVSGIILSSSAVGLTTLVIILLSVLTLTAVLNFVVNFLSGDISARLLADLRASIYNHLQSLPLGFHHSQRQGDTIALMTNEIARLSAFLSSTVISIPPLMLTALGAIVLMFRIDAKLALIIPILVPVFYVILKIIGRKLRGLAQQIQRAEADIVGMADENLQMLPAIKTFTREHLESARYRAKVDHSMRLTRRQNLNVSILAPLMGLISSSAAVLLLVFAGKSLQAGQMTPAQLVSFLLYAALLTRPVSALSNVYGQIQTARGTLARLGSVLEKRPESGYAVSARLPHSRGAISFTDVHFAYAGREPILRGLDLQIAAGETVALTGLNGVGKSTLINLLLRMYDPQQGAITIDGTDISTINVQDLRRQIGIVPQRALLFNGSIRANIGYGSVDADDAAIEQAARLSQAYQFIMELPQGFDTQIGDQGVRLSGGQRQRISLARAFLKDPSVLVLDEATSMYDLEGEAAFVDACSAILGTRTVIIITHRSASLALADRILRVEDGVIREVDRNEFLTVKPYE